MSITHIVFSFIKDYGLQLSAIGAAISFIFVLLKFAIERRDTHYWKEFEVYHKIVKELVEPDKETGTLYMDRQAAIVYELRNFKRYYPISLRMLTALLIQFEESECKYERLNTEIRLTIDFIKKL